MAHAPAAVAGRPFAPRPATSATVAPTFSRADGIGIAALDGARRGDERAIAVARRDAAANIEALHRIYNGIDRQSPARGINHGKPVALAIPRDLNGAFRKFLTHRSQPSAHFRNDDPRARPNANGTLTAGKAVTYSLHELPHTGDGKRHVVVTIGGFSSGELENSSTPGRIWNNKTRAGNQGAEIGKLVLGADGEYSRFGRALGDFFSKAQRQDPSLVMSFNGHSLGAEAASKALQTVTEQGARAKVALFNPGPLTEPDDPHAFAAGVEKAGGEREFRKLGATFRSDKDPVDIVQRLPIARQLLEASGAAWDASRYTTGYQYVDENASGADHHNHPARNIVHGFNRPNALASGRREPIGMAYLRQIAEANRMVVASRR